MARTAIPARRLMSLVIQGGQRPPSCAGSGAKCLPVQRLGGSPPAAQPRKRRKIASPGKKGDGTGVQAPEDTPKREQAWPRYLVLKPKGPSKIPNNPFLVRKTLQGLVGEQTGSVKTLMGGSLMVQVMCKGQSDNLLRTTSFVVARSPLSPIAH